MNGTRYYRRLANLRITALAEETGIAPKTIIQMEKDSEETGFSPLSPKCYIIMSDYFGVPIDDLIRTDYPEIAEPERNINRFAKNECADNPLAKCRHERNLGYRIMGKMLGISHEEVRQICMNPGVPEKYRTVILDTLNIAV